MSSSEPQEAPGSPGIPPTWCSAAKEMVGCSLGASRVWFTIGGGIVNEVYYPRVDTPQIRDLGFIVADGHGLWVEVKRIEQHTVTAAADGIPAVTIVHHHPRFELTLRIVPAAQRDVLLVRVELAGDATLKPYALLAPHLGGSGRDNLAEVNESRGRKILWARQGPYALALAAADAKQRDAFTRASAGYVGVSDGWQDFAHNGAMTFEYPSAGPGNVALVGELAQSATLALAFSSGRESAATLAITALLESFEKTWAHQVDSWKDWHDRARKRVRQWPQLSAPLERELRTSAMVLRAHQDKTYPGTMVASLSVPWGNTRDEIGGYHLVWPRDLVECAGALLVLGAVGEACNTLRYLIATQRIDGHWNQNQWLGGTSYWTGLQLDETAFPVLLAVGLADRGALAGIEIGEMIRRALGYVVRSGPATAQDRWEEDAGLNAFTLAVCIAALVSGAAYLEPPGRELAYAVADYWNARLEDWTTARGTPLASAHGIDSYYVRVAPAQILTDPSAIEAVLPVKNWRTDPDMKAWQQVGVDFLQLVRFGLRRADDPVILSSLKLVDALLEVRLPTGRSWYRYTSDGYGEHPDGSGYDGSGQGRAWPLLTGERGHYELAAGRDPLEFLEAMAAMASSGGMLPEQVWDAPSIPEHGLVTGRATGSAMPLAWAHAEFVKLAVSRELQHPCDRPTAVWERYGGRRPSITRAVWSEAAPITSIPHGARLLLALNDPAQVISSIDGWRTLHEQATRDSGIGVHVAELDTGTLAPGTRIELTFQRTAGQWAGRNFALEVTGG
ncbi:MAG TPA: glycoside hydrolase family 15 protein [Steroidobacteraceae bacterium]|nr:glycoside hydrolase family 15 protein [Steroidobacteraceae bacterium]